MIRALLMPRNTPVGNCKLSPAFLVAVFATAFLVSPRKYQLKIIHILPLVGRKHGTCRNDMFNQQKISNSMLLPQKNCKSVITSSYRTKPKTTQPDGTTVVILLKPEILINIWRKPLGRVGWHYATDYF